MVFLRILRLRYEVNMLQANRVHNPEPEHHLHGVLAPSCRRVSPMFIGRKHQQEAICIGTNAPAVDISLPG